VYLSRELLKGFEGSGEKLGHLGCSTMTMPRNLRYDDRYRLTSETIAGAAAQNGAISYY
jgi:hypothetical protein